MKSTSLKLILLLISILIMMQGCIVYSKVDYQTAVASGKKVKVKMSNKKSYKFKKVRVEEENLIGVKYKPVPKRFNRLIESMNVSIDFENNQIVNYSINKNQVLEFKQHDATLSVLVTIFLGIPFLLIPLAPILWSIGVV